MLMAERGIANDRPPPFHFQIASPVPKLGGKVVLTVVLLYVLKDRHITLSSGCNQR